MLLITASLVITGALSEYLSNCGRLCCVCMALQVLPFAMMLYLAGSMSHADAAVVQVRSAAN
jgi:hypothetical protein